MSFAFAGVTMPESQTRPDSLAQKRVEMIFKFFFHTTQRKAKPTKAFMFLEEAGGRAQHKGLH